MFDYDWFYGKAYAEHQEAARYRVATRKYPKLSREKSLKDERFKEYMAELECRTLMYLRDGYSYELKSLASEVESKAHLTFECEPTDELYKVGAFVVVVPFEEIARVEVYAVHPNQKPENTPMITGFRTIQREDGRNPSQ